LLKSVDVVVTAPDGTASTGEAILSVWHTAEVSKKHDDLSDEWVLLNVANQLRDPTTKLVDMTYAAAESVHISVQPTDAFMTRYREQHDVDLLAVLAEAELIAPEASRNPDLVYSRSGAIETQALKQACLRCSFSGGQSLLCSTHWKELGIDQKRSANEAAAVQVLAKLGTKEQRLAAERAADAERAAALEREAAEVKRVRDEAERAAAEKAALAKAEGRCFAEIGANRTPLPEPDRWGTFSCGLAPLDADHDAHREHALPALADAAARITELLNRVEEGSSDGGEPYCGFVCRQEHVVALKRSFGGSTKSAARMTAKALFRALRAPTTPPRQSLSAC
jgi:hypothetical protein